MAYLGGSEAHLIETRQNRVHLLHLRRPLLLQVRDVGRVLWCVWEGRPVLYLGVPHHHRSAEEKCVVKMFICFIRVCNCDVIITTSYLSPWLLFRFKTGFRNVLFSRHDSFQRSQIIYQVFWHFPCY